MFYQKASSSGDTEVPFCCTFPISFRLCCRRDLRDLEWFGMFYTDRAIIEQAFANQEEGKNLMLLAEANRFPIGQIWIDLARKRAQGVGLLWALRVLPPFQSQNIGTQLLVRGETALLRRGFEFAELSVAKSNLRAKKLYHRLGYQLAQPHTTEEHADEWILRKSLKPEPGQCEEPLGRNLTPFRNPPPETISQRKIC